MSTKIAKSGLATTIVHPEDYRRDPVTWSEKIAAGDAIALLGNSEVDATYVITPAKLLEQAEIAQLVPVSTGQIKKDFTTARGLIRYCNISFIVTSKGQPLVKISRNPSYDRTAFERLLHKRPKVWDAIESLDPCLGTAFTGEAATDGSDLKQFLSEHFDRLEFQNLKQADRILSAIEARKK